MALPREKAPDLVTMCLQKEKVGWESLTVLEKYPKLKQVNASLWALENNGIGLIQGIELRKVAYRKDKLWPRVKQISFVERE